MCEENLAIKLETSPEMNEFFGALAKAQGEIKPAKKDMVNSYLKKGDGALHRYSSLTACLEACKPLAENGIAISQIPISTNNGDLHLVTILGHESGQWMKGTLLVPDIPVQKPLSALQTLGVRLTYAKRYSLASMTGVASDEDTDGNVEPEPSRHAETRPSASNSNGNGKPATTPPPARPWKPETVRKMIKAKAKELAGTVKIEDAAVVGDKLVETLQERLIGLFAGDETVTPEDVNSIIPQFLEGCLGVNFLSELKVPFGNALLKYLSKSEDKELHQKEIMSFTKE